MSVLCDHRQLRITENVTVSVANPLLPGGSGSSSVAHSSGDNLDAWIKPSFSDGLAVASYC